MSGLLSRGNGSDVVILATQVGKGIRISEERGVGRRVEGEV
jgi:hypothetical protein